MKNKKEQENYLRLIVAPWRDWTSRCRAQHLARQAPLWHGSRALGTCCVSSPEPGGIAVKISTTWSKYALKARWNTFAALQGGQRWRGTSVQLSVNTGGCSAPALSGRRLNALFHGLECFLPKLERQLGRERLLADWRGS